MDENPALPLGLALSSVLAARLDGAGRPALLAAVTRVPTPRRPLDDVIASTPSAAAAVAAVAAPAQPEARRS